ncbi:MAG TPA: DUF262 domain-containing protein [Candidatus Wunengus sp. YC60]|uniref:DUF262 domain-containing protein n=1 Tax=Candidatus Wunengus sp. YC60 TaxID=3367697 RepID=UPI00402A2F74
MVETRAINKIDVYKKAVKDILSERYIVDYFQREYKWQTEEVAELISDLENKFLQDYNEGDNTKDVAKYGYYYLGSVILSSKGTEYSIIDGQQRLTTLTLLLIFLHNLQVKLKLERPINLSNLISSDDFEFSPNIGVKEWAGCLQSLYEGNEEYNLSGKSLSINNLIGRYEDIGALLSEKTQNGALQQFIVWLKQNVIFSQIITYSDEDAYRIFEAMNDRGLDLTYTEMLKGYLLVKVEDEEKISELNKIWKETTNKINLCGENEDLKFFTAFFRAKYAKTTGQKIKDVEEGDFERIGSNFYRWLIQNENLTGIDNRQQLIKFLEKEIPYFARIYTMIYNASQNLIKGLGPLYYINKLGFAETISYSLLLAPIIFDEDDHTLIKKLFMVSSFLEMFTVFMAVNSKRYAQSLIKNTLYPLTIKIRNTSVEKLKDILIEEYNNFDYYLYGINKNKYPNDYNPGGIFALQLNGQNRKVIKFLLARITTFIENHSAIESSFENYLNTTQKKPYQIEHLWCDNYELFKEEFTQRDEWLEFRNSIGALILLPEGTNQSHNKDPYIKKLPHYLKENLLAKSLHPNCYVNNPNFTNFVKKSNLPFKPHEQMKKEDIHDRLDLYYEIGKLIWNKKVFEV